MMWGVWFATPTDDITQAHGLKGVFLLCRRGVAMTVVSRGAQTAAMQRGRRRRSRPATDSPAMAARGAPATADYGSAGAARHNILRQKGYKGRGGKGRTLTAAPCCAAACVSWWLNSSLVLCGRQLIITIQKLENTEFSKSYGLWHFFYAKSGDFLQISAPSEELGTLKVT